MTKLNCTIIESDDNNLIFESRGRGATTKVIPKDKEAAGKLYGYVEEAIAAQQPKPSTESAKQA